MSWTRVEEIDRGKKWQDWVSPNGKYKLAQGHLMPANTWSLFVKKDGKWRWVRTVPGLRQAMKALDALSARAT